MLGSVKYTCNDDGFYQQTYTFDIEVEDNSVDFVQNRNCTGDATKSITWMDQGCVTGGGAFNDIMKCEYDQAVGHSVVGLLVLYTLFVLLW